MSNCPDCGGKTFKDVYDGGNGEGARIRVVKEICEDCAKIVKVR